MNRVTVGVRLTTVLLSTFVLLLMFVTGCHFNEGKKTTESGKPPAATVPAEPQQKAAAAKGRWVPINVGATVPGNAVIAGVEPNGDINYICRGPKNHALFTGKGVLKKCLIAFNDDQVETEGNSYEILIGSKPRWERWNPTPGPNPAANWFEGGYEDRDRRFYEPVCLGLWVANQQIPGKLLTFDHDGDGACHVEAGGLAFKEDDRNKFLVLADVAAPVFENTPTKEYIWGYEANLVDGRRVFKVWTGGCSPVNHGRYAKRSVPDGVATSPSGQKCNGLDVLQYEFQPGSLQ